MSVMKTIVEMIHVPLKCRHMEGLSFSGLDSHSNFLILPTMNLSTLNHCIYGKWIHELQIIQNYWLHSCPNHSQNAQRDCLSILFYANNEACHVVNDGLI
jgi:hypothetical protein